MNRTVSHLPPVRVSLSVPLSPVHLTPPVILLVTSSVPYGVNGSERGTDTHAAPSTLARLGPHPVHPALTSFVPPYPSLTPPLRERRPPPNPFHARRAPLTLFTRSPLPYASGCDRVALVPRSPLRGVWSEEREAVRVE